MTGGEEGREQTSLESATPPHLLASWRHRAWAFLRRVIGKAEEDGIFFMGGAIAFNVLVAIVPLVLFTVGISSFVLTARFPDPERVVVEFLQQMIPAIGGDLDLSGEVSRQVESLIEQGTGFTVVGAALLVWFSTRLVGTLRTALKEIFDLASDRGIVAGKIFDIQVVLVGGLLFLANILLSAGVRAARDFGLDFLGVRGETLSLLQQGSAHLLAFVSIWVLFLGIYRYLPARRVPWKAAIIAATFMALLHEVLLWGFGWYVTQLANYRTTYGNLITLAVLFFWIYYEALVFILSGEVAQVWTMRRARRVQIQDIHGTVGQGAQDG